MSLSDHETVKPSADAFETHRPALVGLAYRMIGSWSEAEDLVQEAFVRWHGAASAGIESPGAWLRTAVTRLAIDHLRSARVRRERYVGDWLPEPIVTDRLDPEAGAALAESLSMALLLVLDTLAPVERAAYLLRVVFDTPYSEIADALGRSEAACRQLVSCAQRRVRAGRPRATVDHSMRADLLADLMAAVSSGESSAVMAFLADDAILVSDGGGKARALNRPLQGARPIARFLVGAFAQAAADTVRVDPAIVNGAPGLVVWRGDGIETVFTFESDSGRVTHIFAIRNPDKLAAVDMGRTPIH